MDHDRPRTPKGLVVAVDGPSGAGKSTVCMSVARLLGYRYVDTGAMYRAAVLQAERMGASLEDPKALENACRSMRIEFRTDDGGVHTFLNGSDVSALIRAPGMDEKASRVSRFPEVRAVLVALQRQMGEKGGVVMEGRDIGSVVFPEADVKIFLDASPEERAHRRSQQWSAQGVSMPEAQVLTEIRKRDHRDSTREVAPLVKAEGAVTIDTTHLSLKEVVSSIMEIVAHACSGDDPRRGE